MKSPAYVAYHITRHAHKWDCGIESHRHRSKSIAQNCIDRYNGKPPPSRAEADALRVKWTPERLLELLEKHDSGLSCEALAKQYDLTRQRIWDLLRRARSIEMKMSDELAAREIRGTKG